MGEEDKNNLISFSFSKQQHIIHNSTATSHSLICKKLLVDTSKNLLFVAILDEERGVLSELGF